MPAAYEVLALPIWWAGHPFFKAQGTRHKAQVGADTIRSKENDLVL